MHPTPFVVNGAAFDRPIASSTVHTLVHLILSNLSRTLGLCIKVHRLQLGGPLVPWFSGSRGKRTDGETRLTFLAMLHAAGQSSDDTMIV
jgi:hypothetical protein